MGAPLSPKLDWSLANPIWANTLNALLSMPQSSGLILQGVVLVSGTTVIPHKLGRMMQGWTLTDINGAAQIYRSAPLNSTTLTLISTAAVTISLEVF